MRRALLILSGLALSAPAHAQVAVVDNPSLLQQLKGYVLDAKEFALQNQQYLAEAQSLATQVTQLESFVAYPSLGAATGLVQQAGLGSALPINPYAVQSLVSGNAGLNGSLGALSSLSTGSFGTNSVYTCTDASWACQQNHRIAAGNAGQQAIGMNEIQVLEAHRAALESLRAEMATATTPSRRDNLQSAVNTETAWAVQENNRIAATNTMIMAQQSARNQQAEEKLSMDLQHTIDGIPK